MSSHTEQIAMPRYRCHKEVRALLVKSVKKTGATTTLEFADKRFPPHVVDYFFVQRYNPKPGGYFVVFYDGAYAFFTAAEFERECTLITI